MKVWKEALKEAQNSNPVSDEHPSPAQATGSGKTFFNFFNLLERLVPRKDVTAKDGVLPVLKPKRELELHFKPKPEEQAAPVPAQATGSGKTFSNFFNLLERSVPRKDVAAKDGVLPVLRPKPEEQAAPAPQAKPEETARPADEPVGIFASIRAGAAKLRSIVFGGPRAPELGVNLPKNHPLRTQLRIPADSSAEALTGTEVRMGAGAEMVTGVREQRSLESDGRVKITYKFRSSPELTSYDWGQTWSDSNGKPALDSNGKPLLYPVEVPGPWHDVKGLAMEGLLYDGKALDDGPVGSRWGTLHPADRTPEGLARFIVQGRVERLLGESKGDGRDFMFLTSPAGKELLNAAEARIKKKGQPIDDAFIRSLDPKIADFSREWADPSTTDFGRVSPEADKAGQEKPLGFIAKIRGKIADALLLRKAKSDLVYHEYSVFDPSNGNMVPTGKFEFTPEQSQTILDAAKSKSGAADKMDILQRGGFTYGEALALREAVGADAPEPTMLQTLWRRITGTTAYSGTGSVPVLYEPLSAAEKSKLADFSQRASESARTSEKGPARISQDAAELVNRFTFNASHDGMDTSKFNLSRGNAESWADAKTNPRNGTPSQPAWAWTSDALDRMDAYSVLMRAQMPKGQAFSTDVHGLTGETFAKWPRFLTRPSPLNPT